MADLVINESLGFGRRYIQNVEDNSPAAAVLRIHAWVISAVDETLRDMTGNDVAAFETITNVAEATNTGYENIALDETDITVTVDDANNRVDIDIADQTWSSVSAGDVWTDITLAYDAAGTDTDANTEVMYVFDFAVTPNGGDITANFPVPSLRYLQQ